jgi:hypothetical protein
MYTGLYDPVTASNLRHGDDAPCLNRDDRWLDPTAPATGNRLSSRKNPG